MKIIAIIPLLLSSVFAGGPGGPSNTKTAVEGPDKLEKCGCWPIYTKMVECQTVKGVNENIRDCVCVPNPDGWYPSIHGCRACLSADNESEEGQLFFTSMSSVITQLMVSCTENGGGVVSDGHSICASRYQFEACAALNEGRDSWASIDRNGEITNGTFFLNIDDGKDDDDHEDMDHGASFSGATSSISTSVPSPSGSTGPITSASESTSASGTQAAPTSTSTSTSSAIRLAVSGSHIGGLVALAGAFTMGAMLL